MRRSLSHLALCAILCASISGVSAQVQQSLYGLKLRSTFAFPECTLRPKIVSAPGRILSPDDKYAPQPPGAAPCFQHRFYEATANPEIEKNAVVRVIWALDGYPSISRQNSAGVLVLDGQVHRIWFFTRGLQFQKDDIAALIDKFGKPTNVDFKNMQNGFGATFESLIATWDFGDSAAWFESYTDNNNTGMLVLETKVGAEAYKARLNSRQPTGPKM